MDGIKAQYVFVKQSIMQTAQLAGRDEDAVRLLAVTKNAELAQIQAWYDCGQRHFGENRLPHLAAMAEALHDQQGIDWHFIGHLQRNKVADVLRYCSWIESIDSMRLLEKVQQVAVQYNKTVQVLLQLNVSGEQQKYGVAMTGLDALVEAALSSSHVQLRGLMCMAPQKASDTVIGEVFQACHAAFRRIKQTYQLGANFDTLSMGMSQDYPLAIVHGATEVRIGSALYV